MKRGIEKEYFQCVSPVLRVSEIDNLKEAGLGIDKRHCFQFKIKNKPRMAVKSNVSLERKDGCSEGCVKLIVKKGGQKAGRKAGILQYYL